MTDQPKRRGRPPKHDGDRRRNRPSLRCDDAMLAMLHEAARQNGRTLNEEMIRRIAASFSSAPEPQPDTRPVTVSDLRQIVREEIATACLAERIATTFMPGHTINVTGSVRRSASSADPTPVQIFGRDHLPS